MLGIVRAICISDRRGIQKTPVESAVLEPDCGITADAHRGNWHRQVSLLSADKVEEFNQRGAGVGPGDFAENLLVEGIDFRSLPVGTRFVCQEVVLEMTQIGKECHHHCAIYQKMGECIMPREGVFARVLKGGTLHVGAEMKVELPAADRPFTAAVITLSDKGVRGEREDKSGPAIVKRLTGEGFQVVETLLLPDEPEQLKKELIRLCDGRQVSLILTTGGTGFSPRDWTPEATVAVADRNAPGIAEAIRAYSMQFTNRAMLSRGASVIRKQTLIVNLPGSVKAVQESMDAFLPVCGHGLELLRGEGGECGRT